jgi:hypothetical protein
MDDPEYEARKAELVTRLFLVRDDEAVERVAWALCPFMSDDFDYPRLPLPECRKCKWGVERHGGTRGCRFHAQQAALAAFTADPL